MPTAETHYHAPRPASKPDPVHITLIHAGDGVHYPKQSQIVSVHYTAFLSDGTEWDSSRRRNKPLRFRMNTGQVIQGLDDAVSLMSLHERVRLSVPAKLAYGERGFPGLVPPNEPVEFDLELISIV